MAERSEPPITISNIEQIPTIVVENPSDDRPKGSDDAMSETSVLQAIFEKLEHLEDPRLLFKEVSAEVKVLSDTVNQMRKEVDYVKKEIDVLKQNRLKQFMWMKDSLSKLEMDKEHLRDDLEARTRDLNKCIWMIEAAVRDHVTRTREQATRDKLDAILTQTPGGESSSELVESGSETTVTQERYSGETDSRPSTVMNTPDEPPSEGADCSDTDSEPDAEGGFARKRHHIHVPPPPEDYIGMPPLTSEPILPTNWPPEEPGYTSRMTATIMTLYARMHDLEQGQIRWKDAYTLQMEGFKYQLKQFQQENYDVSYLFEEVGRLKKIQEEEDLKGLDVSFMNLAADLICKINVRIKNLEDCLEKQQKNGDFKAYVRNVIDGLQHIQRTQNESITLVRKSQQIQEERKKQKLMRAFKEKEKEELESKSAIRFAQLAVGGLRRDLARQQANSAGSAAPPPK